MTQCDEIPHKTIHKVSWLRTMRNSPDPSHENVAIFVGMLLANHGQTKALKEFSISQRIMRLICVQILSYWVKCFSFSIAGW